MPHPRAARVREGFCIQPPPLHAAVLASRVNTAIPYTHRVHVCICNSLPLTNGDPSCQGTSPRERKKKQSRERIRGNQRESEDFQDRMFVLFFVVPHSLRNEYLTTPVTGRPVGPNPTRLVFGLYTQMVYGPVAFRVTRACLATRSPDTRGLLKTDGRGSRPKQIRPLKLTKNLRCEPPDPLKDSYNECTF